MLDGELHGAVALGYASHRGSGAVNGEHRSYGGGVTAWQLHLLGFALGGETPRVFAGAGSGFEGLGVAGLAGRFPVMNERARGRSRWPTR